MAGRPPLSRRALLRAGTILTAGAIAAPLLAATSDWEVDAEATTLAPSDLPPFVKNRDGLWQDQRLHLLRLGTILPTGWLYRQRQA